MKKYFSLFAIVLMALLAFSVVGVSHASYVPPMTPTVTIPTYVTTNQNFTVYVNDTNGFSNYTVTVYLSGENLTGASPSFSYHNFQASNPDFRVSLKAPNVAQILYINIISGANFGSKYVTSQQSFNVHVIEPIHFYAVVRNTGSSGIHNLTVDFSVDNQFVGSTVATFVPAGASVTVNFTYVNPYLTNGEHTLTVSVNNRAISVDGSAAVYTTHFYYGKPPNYNWIYYVAAIVIAFMIFLAMTAGRRSSVPNRPKWKK